MKFILRILLIAGLAFVLQSPHILGLPFWAAAIAAFIIGVVFGKRPPKRRIYGKRSPHRPLSFWSGFLAVAILWGASAFLQDSQNDSLLSSQLFGVFGVNAIPESMGSLFLIFVTALLGGLLGGFASLTGNALGEAVK